MLFRDLAPLDDSAEAAAALLGDVDADTLIKDYWVAETLRVTSANHGGYFVFKGGTSLTKAVRCVDRFSEDIDCRNNSVAESFFSSLKRELVSRYRFEDRAGARRAIFSWINRYNTRRLHSRLQYLPPIEWESTYHQQPAHRAA